MQYNDLEMLGYRIGQDLRELTNLLEIRGKIDKRTRDYVRLKEAIKIVEKVTGFTKENVDGT
jgi:hypothetical protein